jgi:nucleoside-diphosphate-sugar epimerase
VSAATTDRLEARADRDRRRTALVVGHSGSTGRGLFEYLSNSADWNVVTLGRHASQGRGPHLAVDLYRDDVKAVDVPELADVTHIYNCARVPAADPESERQSNLILLDRLLDLAERNCDRLEHVCLIHGTKWYGCHKGPYRTPALETDPPCDDPSFYAVQQELIVRRQCDRDWTWSALRPHTIWGLPAERSGNSIIMLIAAYAMLMKAAGEPLHFPGPEKTFYKLSQATDSDLLNRAMEWVGTTPAAANQAFNVTNGDFFRWERLWPSVADFFGMDCGEVRPLKLADAMPSLEPHWATLARKHQLKCDDLRSVVNWSYGDGIFGLAWTDMSSTTKVRQFGFSDAIDSGEALLKFLSELRTRRYIA